MLTVFAEHLNATARSVLDQLDLQDLQAVDPEIELGLPQGGLLLTACAVSVAFMVCCLRLLTGFRFIVHSILLERQAR